MAAEDPFNLARFIKAQADDYTTALSEVKAGHKVSHWMWYIFPQLQGLGLSPTAKHYAIRSIAEAKAYLAHPILGPRLLEITQATLGHADRSATAIFGTPDDMKLRSSMTLFATLAQPTSPFEQVLAAFFEGKHDQKTLDLLKDFS